MTQTVKVLKYMQTYGKISQREAVRFGCYRLSARIHDLKRMGYHIATELRSFKNDDGSGYYAEYRLVD